MHLHHFIHRLFQYIGIARYRPCRTRICQANGTPAVVPVPEDEKSYY